MNNDSFEAAKNDAAQLKDGLGKYIDPGILELVAALRYHGIHTIASCEGHIDRFTGGPYVMFEAPGTHKLRKKYRSVKDKSSQEYKLWREKAIQLNIPEIKKMLHLLTDFYNQRKSPNDQHIIVRSFDASVGELICQSAELARILTAAERAQLLQKNQAEMQAFAEYLKLKPLTPPIG